MIRRLRAWKRRNQWQIDDLLEDAAPILFWGAIAVIALWDYCT